MLQEVMSDSSEGEFESIACTPEEAVNSVWVGENFKEPKDASNRETERDKKKRKRKKNRSEEAKNGGAESVLLADQRPVDIPQDVATFGGVSTNEQPTVALLYATTADGGVELMANPQSKFTMSDPHPLVRHSRKGTRLNIEASFYDDGVERTRTRVSQRPILKTRGCCDKSFVALKIAEAKQASLEKELPDTVPQPLKETEHETQHQQTEESPHGSQTQDRNTPRIANSEINQELMKRSDPYTVELEEVFIMQMDPFDGSTHLKLTDPYRNLGEDHDVRLIMRTTLTPPEMANKLNEIINQNKVPRNKSTMTPPYDREESNTEQPSTSVSTQVDKERLKKNQNNVGKLTTSALNVKTDNMVLEEGQGSEYITAPTRGRCTFFQNLCSCFRRKKQQPPQRLVTSSRHRPKGRVHSGTSTNERNNDDKAAACSEQGSGSRSFVAKRDQKGRKYEVKQNAPRSISEERYKVPRR